jgi:hypothetical protein
VDVADWRTDTAERVRPVHTRAPRTPPSVSAPPLPQRYPLFADEVEGWGPDGVMVTRGGAIADHEPTLAPEPLPESESESESESAIAEWFDDEPAAYADPGWDDGREAHRSPWRWILVALLALVVIAAAWWLVARSGDDGAGTGRNSSAADGASSVADPQGATASNVASEATARVRRTAPDGVDVDGVTPTTYAAANLLDGDAQTAWRAAGDASGLPIRVRLAQQTTLTEVGLINGYAKEATDPQGRVFDSYTANRRVTEVEWSFPDGTSVRQTLADGTREPQLLDIDPVTTDRLVLRIVGVTAPGEGSSGRDYTALSEIALLGTPTG